MKEQFLNLQGLNELVDYLKKFIDSQQKILPYKSYALFPTVGSSDSVYIDTSTNAIYRWDDANVKYYPLAFDPTETYTMQCGNSK